MRNNTYSNTTEETLVTFHTGRGGRYWNPGHVSFVEQDVAINAYTDHLFLAYENEYDISQKIGRRENLRALFEAATEVDGPGSSDAIDRIENFTAIKFGELVFVQSNGSPVGLNRENDGTGTINIDNYYDTTVVKRLKDCSEDELQIIFNSDNCSKDVREYVEAALIEVERLP